MSNVFQIGNQNITATELVDILSRYQLIPQLMNNLIIDRAISEFECTPEERDFYLNQFCANNGLVTPEQQQAFRSSFGMNPDQFESYVLRPVLLSKFKTAKWGSKVESYFMTRKAALDKVLYSLIRVKDLGTAQELFFRINEGEESFADLAKAYSQGKEAETGGLVGPAPLSNPHPVIAKTLGVSQPGQLWPPINIEEWYIIVRLEKSFPAQLDESTRALMIDELFNAWLREQVVYMGVSMKLLDNQPDVSNDSVTNHAVAAW